MNKTIGTIVSVFKRRLVRNICFWVFIIWGRIWKPVDPHILSTGTYYALVLFNLSIFILVSLVNNWVLIPRFLARKKYVAYFLLAIALSYAGAFIYTYILKYEHAHFPGLNMFKVSTISSPITNDLSSSAVYREMGSVHTIMYLLIVGFTGMWYVNAYTKKEKLMEEAIKKQVEAELNFLKTQINPHFLFNTLNNLYGLTLMKSDQAPEAILKLSNILRYILYESNVPFISFDREKDIIQAYIDIEMLRLHDSGNVSFTIMSDSKVPVPPLLWLPVLENVFKHGTNIMDDETYIDFRFMIHDGVLHIGSRNIFKEGRQDNKLETYGGIGLDNLAKRLELLYPGRHNIRSWQEGNYYIVNIEIKLT